MSAKKDVILNATRRLLIERGFQDIVLDDVAREAGVAKGTLFLHYKSKDELFSAAFAGLVDQLGEALDALDASGGRGRALLGETVLTVLAYFDRNRDFISQFGAGRFPGCGERSCGKLMGKMGENLRRMARILKACARDGVIGSRDMETAAMALFGLCRASFFQQLITGKRKSLDARARLVVEFFLHGVGKR